MNFTTEQVKRAVRSCVMCESQGLKAVTPMEDFIDAGEIFFNHFSGGNEPRISNLIKHPRYNRKFQLIQRHLNHNYR